jgi:hypothetical protein
MKHIHDRYNLVPANEQVLATVQTRPFANAPFSRHVPTSPCLFIGGILFNLEFKLVQQRLLHPYQTQTMLAIGHIRRHHQLRIVHSRHLINRGVFVHHQWPGCLATSLRLHHVPQLP